LYLSPIKLCRPYKNREPSPFEIDCCRYVKVHPAIDKHNPKVIIALGKSALQSLIGDKYKQDVGGMSKWRGIPIPDYDYGCWIIPTYHPSFIERDKGGAVGTIWLRDIKKAVEYSNQSLPGKITPRVKIIKDLQVLKKYNTLSTIAFDYETTGLKPHSKGHRIVCVSIAINLEDVFVFMMPETKYDRQPFLELLNNPGLGKRAHNMKFEHHWTKTRLRTDIKNWQWDSMLAAHLLDNRPGITGLKFQTYVNFGVADYSSEITPYLQTKEKNANGFNRIMDLIKTREGKEKLLHYCALDSVYEYNLSMKQIETIDYDYLPF
jgi:hypothetical protein